MIFHRIILISGPIKLLFHVRQPAPGHHRGLHPQQARMLGFRNVKNCSAVTAVEATKNCWSCRSCCCCVARVNPTNFRIWADSWKVSEIFICWVLGQGKITAPLSANINILSAFRHLPACWYHANNTLRWKAESMLRKVELLIYPDPWFFLNPFVKRRH